MLSFEILLYPEWNAGKDFHSLSHDYQKYTLDKYSLKDYTPFQRAHQANDSGIRPYNFLKHPQPWGTHTNHCKSHYERLNIFIFLKTNFREALKMDSFGQTTEFSSANFLYTICWVFSLTVTKACGKRACAVVHWPSCPEYSSKCQILFSGLEKLRKGIFSRTQVIISNTYKGTLFENNSAWIAV